MTVYPRRISGVHLVTYGALPAYAAMLIYDMVFTFSPGCEGDVLTYAADEPLLCEQRKQTMNICNSLSLFSVSEIHRDLGLLAGIFAVPTKGNVLWGGEILMKINIISAGAQT